MTPEMYVVGKVVEHNVVCIQQLYEIRQQNADFLDQLKVIHRDIVAANTNRQYPNPPQPQAPPQAPVDNTPPPPAPQEPPMQMASEEMVVAETIEGKIDEGDINMND
jgi:hypothetical protein